jgi:hypothetical protein
MLKRWAEARIYRNTMRVAVQALREAARTSNALEKLRLLDVAEQKLRDATWLRPERADEHFESGIEEIRRSRQRTLKEQAVPAVGRLLEAAGKGIGDKKILLQPAAELLAYLHHYCPEEAAAQDLSACFRGLGGEQRAYRPITPLSEHYNPAYAFAGCGLLLALLAVAAVTIWVILSLLR